MSATKRVNISTWRTAFLRASTRISMKMNHQILKKGRVSFTCHYCRPRLLLNEVPLRLEFHVTAFPRRSRRFDHDRHLTGPVVQIGALYPPPTRQGGSRFRAAIRVSESTIHV